jgi:hypothetical protein
MINIKLHKNELEYIKMGVESNMAFGNDLKLGKRILKKLNKGQTLPIDSVMVCDCTHTQACKICGEKKGLDGDFWKNLKS